MNLNEPSPELLERLAKRLGPKGFTIDPVDMEPWLTDWRGRVRGAAAALLSPASREEVSDIVTWAKAEGVAISSAGREYLDGSPVRRRRQVLSFFRSGA